MQTAKRAPVYSVYYEQLKDISTKLGYSLALHGSMEDDLDLIAIPWTKDCEGHRELLNAFKGYLELVLDPVNKKRSEEIEIKPHGRVAYKFFLEGGLSIDLSIMMRHE